MIIFYRILNFILLPIAGLLAVSTLLSIFGAFSNPALLLVLFVFACVVIYTYTSIYFFNQALILKKDCKAGLKDWIKVNAYVTILFAVFMLLGMAQALTHPELFNQMIQLYKANGIELNKSFSEADMIRWMKGLCTFFLVYAALLLAHIGMTLSLIKKNKERFV